jgi:RNA polymerase sigma factor (TIGR02999 family)
VSRGANVTDLLIAWSAGDKGALASLVPLVYDELLELAHQFMRRERQNHTLQPTALVHEAYARLVEGERVEWQGRTHFFAVAAQTMRRVLVDHARRRDAARRGGGGLRVTLDESLVAADRNDIEVIALDRALHALAALDPVQERIVELRYFGGLTIDEVAGVLGSSPATVTREWTIARAWLHREMSRE